MVAFYVVLSEFKLHQNLAFRKFLEKYLVLRLFFSLHLLIAAKVFTLFSPNLGASIKRLKYFW